MTRVMVIMGVVLGILASTDPAAALSCVRAPDDVAEVTITGEAPAEGWYGDAEVPVVIGRITEGTLAEPEQAGDRLALVEVIGGLRLADVPAEVAIVADGLIGWGHPTYTAGQHVFLRIDEWNIADGDLANGIADGPCSWNQRYSEGEIDALLVLAEEHGVPFVAPTPIVEDEPVESTSTTTITTTTTLPVESDDRVDDAEPIAVAEPETPADDDGIATVAVVLAALVALALLGAAAYTIGSRR